MTLISILSDFFHQVTNLLRHIQLQAFTFLCASLEVQFASQLTAGGKQFFAAVAGVVQNAFQLLTQLSELFLQSSTVAFSIGVIGSLGRQIFHTVQDII
ncbi:Uncharacterised protein [Yersinia frederiksenii]|nr:Uncharacterised protein [Yersinia frederiksenii]